jgi:transcriptional regulator with XRE-family HTH domain
MGINKRMKVGVSILGAVVLIGVGIGYGLYQKEQNRELTIKETTDLKPISFSEFHNSKVKDDGTVTLTFEIDEFLNPNKRKKMDYYIYDSHTNQQIELPLNSQDSAEYTIDFKQIAERKIQQYIREGENGQFTPDEDRMEQLLNDVYKNDEIYFLAVPKGYLEKEEKRLGKLNKEKFAKEHSFYSIGMSGYIELLNRGLKPDFVRYTSYTEYVISLVTRDLSNEEFVKLVKAVQLNVPKQIEILKSHLFEGQFSERLKDGYFARGNYDYRRLGYVVAEDYSIGIYSPVTAYLRTYSVPANEEQELNENMKDWNQRIIDDKTKFEEQSNTMTLDKSIQKVGLIDNALFSYKNTNELGERLEIKEDTDVY